MHASGARRTMATEAAAGAAGWWNDENALQEVELLAACLSSGSVEHGHGSSSSSASSLFSSSSSSSSFSFSFPTGYSFDSEHNVTARDHVHGQLWAGGGARSGMHAPGTDADAAAGLDPDEVEVEEVAVDDADEAEAAEVGEAALVAVARGAEHARAPMAERATSRPPPRGEARRKRKAREEQQYTKLRFTPPAEGVRTGAWHGTTADGQVHAVYRAGFQHKAQQRCVAQPNVWLKVPPGNARVEEGDALGGQALEAADRARAPPAGRVADGTLLSPAVRAPEAAPCGPGPPVRGGDVPAVAWPQGRRDSCVFCSAASALAHLGEAAAAAVVGASIPASLRHPNPMALLHDVLKSKAMQAVRKMEVLGVFKRARLDPLADASPHPTTVQLLGEDGGVGHAVTIVDGWVFDATLAHALPLSRAALDECCSSARGRVAYKCVERAVRYRPRD